MEGDVILPGRSLLSRNQVERQRETRLEMKNGEGVADGDDNGARKEPVLYPPSIGQVLHS
jgi:hypothetical protein